MNDDKSRVIQEFKKEEVQDKVTGKPGKDTDISSPKVDENVNKSAEYIDGFIEQAINFGFTEKQAFHLLIKDAFVKEDSGKYYVHSEKGKRLSRGYNSHEEATKRLEQGKY